MEQALAFLAACARHPDGRLSPSKAVDAGWHAFILHTADYAEFCQRTAGRFIHHLPDDPASDGSGGGATIAATIATMRADGLHVDTDLWGAPADGPGADCHQCHAGCHDSPDRMAPGTPAA